MVELEELREAARNVVNNSLLVQPGERMLLVANPGTRRIAEALKEAAEKAGAQVEVVKQGRKTALEPAEPHVLDALRKAIKEPPDVIYAVLAHKLGVDPIARTNPLVHENVSYVHHFSFLREREPKRRIYWSPSITEEIFAGLAKANFEEIHRRAEKIKKVLAKALALEIKTVDAQGREHTLVVKIDETNYPARLSSGWAGKRVERRQGNLPGGEWYTTPVTANGAVVIDGSMSHLGGSNVVKTPFVLRFEKGFVTQVEGEGSDAEKLRESLEKSAAKARKDFEGAEGEKVAQWTYQIGEVALGLNDAIKKAIGVMVSDEKMGGTGHVAVGAAYHGERQKTPTHFDLIFTNAKISALFKERGKTKSEVLVQGGKMKF